MWAEARKQEKKIRGILVDHKKRAERRREFYEKIKQDPAQFLQISGRSCKFHIDHNGTGAEPRGSIMPWQGNKDILIDRFDVRAHLDYIAEVTNNDDEHTYPEESKEMRPLNYERYRILIQNGFLKIKEEKFLRTIALEEKFGGKTYQQQKAEDDKKKIEKSKAAIGFTYEDSTDAAAQRDQSSVATKEKESTVAQAAEELSESDDDFDDLDTVINFSALSTEQQLDLNNMGKAFFLGREDFIKYLQHEAEEQENAKNAKAEEDEKSAFSGRKSRKERRILKEKRLAGRIPSPPSYATYENSDKKRKSMDRSSSEESSRSASPVNKRGGTPGKVEYITTFGEENTKRSGSKDKKSKKRSKRDRSSSSSSSSDDGRGKYRSKYRRKRRSSSSSSSEDENNGTSKVVEPPPPPPVKRYYGRKREDSDEEKLTEDEEESSAQFTKSDISSYQMYSREASNVSIFKIIWTLQFSCPVPHLKALNFQPMTLNMKI